MRPRVVFGRATKYNTKARHMSQERGKWKDGRTRTESNLRPGFRNLTEVGFQDSGQLPYLSLSAARDREAAHRCPVRFSYESNPPKIEVQPSIHLCLAPSRLRGTHPQSRVAGYFSRVAASLRLARECVRSPSASRTGRARSGMRDLPSIPGHLYDGRSQQQPCASGSQQAEKDSRLFTDRRGPGGPRCLVCSC